MAIKLELEHLPGLKVPDTYWMPGVIELREFDETARIEWWGFLSEDARHQRVPDEAADLRRPIKVITLTIPHAIYVRYLAPAVHSAEGQNIREAVYRMSKEVAEPFGLKALFESGADHFQETQ